MSFDQLTDEAWKYVLQYLTPTLPIPLSGVTQEEVVVAEAIPHDQLPKAGAPGTTSRSDIKAGALACLMRTSIAFNQLATRPLYRRIITDQAAGLLENYLAPAAHPQLESKRELLKHVRSLQLEYSPKGEPTYFQLFADPRQFLAAGSPSRLDAAVLQAEIEVDQVYSAMETVHGHIPFPKLVVASVGSVFGSQDGLWKVAREAKAVLPISRDKGGISRLIRTTTACLELLLQSSPLTHFCQRGHLGPLSLPNFITWKDPVSGKTSCPKPHFTMHFDTHNDRIPVALGHPTRWVLEQHERSKAVPYLFERISHAMDYSLEGRISVGNKLEHIDVDAYCSSNSYNHEKSSVAAARNSGVAFDLDPAGERQVCHNMQGSMFKVWKKSGVTHEEDALSWKASIDSPSCWACGWQFQQDKPKNKKARAKENAKSRLARRKWETWEDMEYD